MAASIIPAVVAGGATLAGGLINSAGSIWSAEKQMRFQERMSSTAHQREVEDLRKAGLNPMLSLKTGGAFSPPGARSDIDIGADKAVNSALQASLLKSQIEVQHAQANQANSAAALNNAHAKSVSDTLPVTLDKIRADTASALQGVDLSKSQIGEIAQRIAESQQRIKLLIEQGKTEEARALKEKATQLLWKRLGEMIGETDKRVTPRLRGLWHKVEPLLPWVPGLNLMLPNSAKSLEGGEK